MNYLIILSILLINFSASATVINFGYGVHNSSPYILTDKESNATGGLLYELAEFVGKEMGVGFKMINTPRTRLEDLVRSGTIDIYCNSNRNWIDGAEDFYWYSGIFVDENLLYTFSEDLRKIKDLQDIKVKVGTINGFSYHPRIEKLLKRVGRNELKSHEKLLRFLELDRGEIIYGSKKIIESQYIGKTRKIYPVTDFRDRLKYDCIISKKIKFNKDKLFKALEKYKLRK
ncbi:transporter substrate-binding domain-containing protein [Halobacteriovorax sp. JY17]|uniref:transporter substrate-binding domain-containing protein n=1 Tax=Halobacteriovorax sp. JY17 TaxID=2014617 RepID=UPI0025BE361E|nr:transporter substrate-binding domain-containing protein [Halobacteriovorax sp. JY17]